MGAKVKKADALDELLEEARTVINDKKLFTDGSTIINLEILDTPLGKMVACATNEGLCLLEFIDRRAFVTELKDLKRLLRATIEPGTNKHLKATEKQLNEYFEGKRKKFDLPLITPGSEFQNKVWQKLLDIPYGETRSYKQQSIAVGNLGAIRAVGTANGANRISIIVPCHRVIGEDGSLTGYGGGLKRKRWLLDFESGALTLFNEE
jgi:AraC family transcriptional regulator, regulatory protein of adaptative response / methylated-DNA-[protein]-cysteine methyltransferase